MGEFSGLIQQTHLRETQARSARYDCRMRSVLLIVWHIVRSVWKIVLAVATLIGILYLPQNIEELPVAVEGPWAFLADQLSFLRPYMTREAALIAFATLLVSWLAWVDVRPFALRWFARRKTQSIEIAPDIYCETWPINSPTIPEGFAFYNNVFYLAVGNGLKTGQTLKRVQTRLFHIGPPTQCKIKDADSGDTDIRHGEWAYFEIGRVTSREMMGLVFIGQDVSEDDLRRYVHNIPLGHLSFQVEPLERNQKYGLGYQHGMDAQFSLLAVVSADDTKASQAVINITFSDKGLSVTLESNN